jgi:ribosomal protein S18 acetylase RimI-like enzyme
MTDSSVSLGTLRFRRATIDDAAELAALVNSCYRGDSSRKGWTTEADLLDGTRTDTAEVETLITAHGSAFLLCVSNGEVIGSVHLQQDGSSCHLGMLVVRPDLQGSGIGRRLMQAGEEFARGELGAVKMTMHVITMRRELLAYYQRRGYRRTGEIEPFHVDETHGLPKVEGIELELLEKELQ